MNRDEAKGKAEALKGKAKQATGDLTDDPNLQVASRLWLKKPCSR
jgi:uncharacterized protein YjbJ (UPF0337 family)